MSANCPICNNGAVVRETWPVNFEYQAISLSADYIQEYCSACGTTLQSPAIIRENVRSKQRVRNIHDGLLAGEQIRNFRESFDITQKVAAELFGGGPSAFAKYEVDEIAHNMSMDRLLRLCIAEPKNILVLAAECQIELPAKVSQRVKDACDRRFMATVAEALAALKEASPSWKTKAQPPANDSIFEIYAANTKQNKRTSSEWALEQEMAA